MNLVGGLRSNEILLTVFIVGLNFQSFDRPVSLGVACFGEMAYQESETCKNGEECIKEVMKQGFQSVLVPAQNLLKRNMTRSKSFQLEFQLIQFYEDRF